jgi:hypothetical protein
MNPSKINHFLETQYGFEWGEMEIERTASGPKWGWVVTIQTSKQIMEIRATPSGIIRFGKPVKKRKETNK